MSDLICKTNSKDSEKCSKSKQQEMRDNFDIITIERKKYLQKKIMLHTVSMCLIEDVDLTEELKDKVRTILLSAKVSSCMNIGTIDSEQKLLGLSNLNEVELSFVEQEKLNHAVHNKFKIINRNNIHSSLLQNYLNDMDLFNLSVQDKILFDNRRKLNDLQETYMNNLKNMYSLLQDFLQLRFKDVKEMVENKIEDYSIKYRMYSLKSEIIKEKSRMDIFNETAVSFNAYKQLLNDIAEQQEEYQNKIDELIQLNEKYKFVLCKEYDEILKSFLQYKSSIQKKKALYKQLQEK